MEILWVTGGIFVLIIGITKFVEYTNRKEAYNRAVKIAQGNNEN
jgi:hypothetical protein|tara:strand:+ start:129 stop:260 length:132 start_codon:yes stop_codon:yes gene_type:complete